MALTNRHDEAKTRHASGRGGSLIGRWEWLAIAAVCAAAFLPGLDRHGVTNWQEAQRLVVAREMQSRLHEALGDWKESRRESIADEDAAGDEPASDGAKGSSLRNAAEALLVPTANGKPYLAKPPMIYWAQIAAAEALGERVELWHLRLVVAIAAILGVVATVFTARALLTPERNSAACGLDGRVMDRAWLCDAVLWSALTLATGILFVRSGRIGELDIMMVPLCTGAIGAVACAWRRHREERDTDFVMVGVAAVLTTMAVLVKDPAVMVVGLTAFGGIALWAANVPAGTGVDVALVRGRRRAELVPMPETGRAARAAEWVIGAACALAAGVAALMNLQEGMDLLGVAIIAGLAGFIGVMLARLAQPMRFRAMFVAMSRTHPVLVIGVPVLVRLAWAWGVAELIGTQQAGQLVQQEVEDNVRLFVPEAPLNNLEAMAFGVGLASVFAAFTLVWVVRDRPRMQAGWFQLCAWLVFQFAAFSVLGKGVQRYLTPMWPAIAIFGGIGIASLLADARARRWVRPVLVVGVIALAVGQGWWYGYGRDLYSGERSPRDLVRELRSHKKVIEHRVVSVEFAHPALDYYMDRHVQPVGDPRVNSSMSGGIAWSFEKLRISVERKGAVFALIRTGGIPGVQAETAIERLEKLGLRVREVETDAKFVIDAGRSEVRCYKVTKGDAGDARP